MSTAVAPGSSSLLTVITTSRDADRRIARLRDRVPLLAVVSADAPAMASARALNAIIDDSPNPWILLVHDREEVSAALASEICQAIGESPKAWAFRIRTETIYAGHVIASAPSTGDIRLLHRRHARLDPDGAVKIQGTVVRLQAPISVRIYETFEEHRAWLAANAVPHTSFRRLLLFFHRVITKRAMSAAAIRYHWIESGWDRGRAAFSGDTSRTPHDSEDSRSAPG